MPNVVVIAGPNGAGKSTSAPVLLPQLLNVSEYVNADAIARGLSGFDPDKSAFAAGRLMLERLRELAAARADFAFETTLASKTYAPWLRRLAATGYQFHLLFLYLPDAEMAVDRVRTRVQMGGHHVPEETIRRRYDAGLRNFFMLYQMLAGSWTMLDNSGNFPCLIARGQGTITEEIVNTDLWNRLTTEWVA